MIRVIHLVLFSVIPLQGSVVMCARVVSGNYISAEGQGRLGSCQQFLNSKMITYAPDVRAKYDNIPLLTTYSYSYILFTVFTDN